MQSTVISFEQRQLSHVLTTSQECIEQWLLKLMATPRLELGDNPALVEALCSDLQRVARLLKSVSRQFDLPRVSLKVMNAYFVVAGVVNEVSCFVEDIRASEFGSRRNTRQVIEYLQ